MAEIVCRTSTQARNT